MPRVIVVGGGLAGLAAAAALGESGFTVDLLEARGFLGGRASSYPINDEVIDNCQHVLLRSCVNLLDLYRRLGVSDRIRFHREFHFLEPGGRVSTLRAGLLPAPLHLAGSFLGMRCLSLQDKVAIARGLRAIRRERLRREDLDRITMLEWLREKRQTPGAVERFWRQVLVSAVNEEPERMAAGHGFQVFWLGFLARADACEMGVPGVPLSELYQREAWAKLASVQIHLRTTAERIVVENGRFAGVMAGGRRWEAGACICAAPFERVESLAPELGLDFAGWEHSPITGIHLWFDRPVTRLPHATLLDRTIQWFFNKGDGRYLLVVVSASRSLLEKSRSEVIQLGLEELAEFLPAAREAKLEKAHVVKEARATFSARPGLGSERPGQVTEVGNLFLAGDWTRTGWPATMEGAVRSGYLAAEAVSAALGREARFLLSDIA